MKDKFIYRAKSLKKNCTQRTMVSETRASELHETRHDVSGRVFLVISKYSLNESSPEEQTQIDYLHKMVTVSHSELVKIVEYGIDAAGYGFCIFEWFESSEIKIDQADQNSILSNFIKCTTAVSWYHENSLLIGDLGYSSFRRAGNDIFILPCLGAFETAGKRTIQISNPLLSDYIAPEQRINGESSVIGDVYSLGVLGYYLAIGIPQEISNNSTFETPLLKRVPAPSSVSSSVPAWFDQLLGHCIATDPKKRIKDVSQVSELLQSGIQTGVLPVGDVKWQSLDLIKLASYTPANRAASGDLQKNERGNAPSTKGRKENSSQNDPRSQKKQSVKFFVILIWLSTVVIGSGIAVALFLSFRFMGLSPDDLSSDAKLMYEEMQSESLRSQLLFVFDEANPEDARIQTLRKIIGKKTSWDATLADIFAAKSFSSQLIPDFISAVSEHEKTLGYSETFNEVFSDFTEKRTRINDTVYLQAISLTLVSIDPSVLPDKRQGAVRRLYVTDTDYAFKLTGLLAKESSALIFLPVLRDFTATKYYQKIPTDVSTTILSILARPVRESLGDLDVIMNNLTNDDLKKLLGIILDQDPLEKDDLGGKVIELYVERFELSPSEKYFLNIAKDSSIDNSMKRIFNKIALGTIHPNDLTVFIEWNDSRWEDVLYRTCLVSADEKVLAQVIDILQRRAPRKKQALHLTKWLKSNFWNRRGTYARSVCVFALKEEASEDQLNEAFEKLMPVSQHGLFSALVETGDSYFITQAAERLSAILTSEEVLPYLDHEIKEVRIASVRALIGKNDLPTLQRILRAYKREKDPEVKALYNKYHWVTADQEIPESLKSNTLTIE